MTLRDHGLALRVVRPDRGEQIPTDLDNVDGVVTLGGPQQVDEKHAWLAPEMDFVKAAHEAALPVVGVCLGAQIIAKALGGSVGQAEEPEVGFLEATVDKSAHTDTVLAGVPWRTNWFHHHSYEVKEAPAGARVLMSSQRCAIQAFAVGMRTYAFQLHIEADRSIIDDLTADAKTDLHRMGVTSQEFAQQLETIYPRFAGIADRLCVNIATYLIPRVGSAMVR